VTLAVGTATSDSTTLLGAGKHTVVAHYSGDGSDAANDGSYSQSVARASLTVVADDKVMNHFDALPALTHQYTGFVNGEDATSAGIVASIGLATTGTSTSPAGYYPIQPTVDSFSAANYVVGGTQDGTLTVKPKVMDATVEFGGKSMSLLGLARDLPFINIRAIDVVFSDDVAVDRSMLTLTGVNVPTYGFSGFSYDPAAHKATWSLPGAIGVDRLMLALSGESAPPVSGSGPNIGADPFSNAFAVLPGDVSGDCVVTSNDLVLVRNQILAGTYSIWDDIDGNGVVDITDYTIVRKRIGTRLP
jgi:hypothetical protein